MHRIDTKTAQKDKFGAGKNGFTRGNPQTGTPATDLDDDYFDMLQEELCSVVEASGASLEKGRHDQLLTALRALLLSRKNPFGDIKSDGTVKTALENLPLRNSSGTVQLVTPAVVKVTRFLNPNEPSLKPRKCYVKVIGGGASGGIGSTTASAVTCGGGGGGGGVAEGLVDLTGINSVSITVGAGGAPVSGISVNGKNGGSSSFGTYMSASGGYSGGQPSGGLGAVGVGGTINTSLGPGSPGSIASAASGAGNGGSGGGPGGAGSFRDTANGKAVSAVGPGGGGAGLCPNSSTGQSGAGADGAVYIYW